MAQQKISAGEDVTLFARQSSFERLLRSVPSLSNLRVHDFSTNTTPDLITDYPKALRWLDRLPSLDTFQTVICDNLPEILAIRPDAIISANFFWHDVIQDTDPRYLTFCHELLASYCPVIYGCALFAMPSIRSQQNFQPVGLYKMPELVQAAELMSPESRTDLLITGGTTPTIRRRLKDIISSLLQLGPVPYSCIHVDKEIIPDQSPNWMIPADFTPSMYCKIRTAICRPGLGVLTDLLTVGSEIIPVYEDNNKEMLHNSRTVLSISSPVSTDTHPILGAISAHSVNSTVY